MFNQSIHFAPKLLSWKLISTPGGGYNPQWIWLKGLPTIYKYFFNHKYTQYTHTLTHINIYTKTHMDMNIYCMCVYICIYLDVYGFMYAYVFCMVVYLYVGILNVCCANVCILHMHSHRQTKPILIHINKHTYIHTSTPTHI